MSFKLALVCILGVSMAQAQMPQIQSMPIEMQALLQKENNEYITTLNLLKVLDQQLVEVEQKTLEFVETGRPLEIAGIVTAITSISIAIIAASLTRGTITPSTSRMMAAYSSAGLSMLGSVTNMALEVKKNEVALFDTLQMAVDFADHAKLGVDQETEFSSTQMEVSARLHTLRNHLLNYQKDQRAAKSEVLVATTAQFFGGLAAVRGIHKQNTLIVGSPIFMHIGNLLHVSTRLSRDRGAHFLSIIGNTRKAIASVIR